MKLIFLGTGSAFIVGHDNYHSNMILENEHNERLLIDCGSDARFSLNELGLSYKDIHSVYVSHLHADHAGGLEWLAFTNKFDPQGKKPNLFINDLLSEDLWNKTLSGGLSSLEGTHANLSSYFNVHPIKEGGSFNWSGIKIKLVRTIHIMSGYNVVPSYGLIFIVDGITVLITTDTQFRPTEFSEFYKKADIIFHDCEVSDHKSGVHPNYNDLCTLDKEIKNKMWLYHYNAHTLPDAKKDGFRGFVKKGQVFDFKNLKSLS